MIWGLKFDIFVLIFSYAIYSGTKGFIDDCVVDIPQHFRRVKPAKAIKRFFRIKRETIPRITYIQCISVVAFFLCVLALYLLSIILTIFVDPRIGSVWGPIAVILIGCLLGFIGIFPNSFVWIYYEHKMEKDGRKAKRKLRREAKKAGTYKKSPTLWDEITDAIVSSSKNKRMRSFLALEKELKKFYIDSKYSKKSKCYITSKNAQKAEELISSKYSHIHVQYEEEKGEKVMCIYGKYSDNSSSTILKAVVKDRN